MVLTGTRRAESNREAFAYTEVQRFMLWLDNGIRTRDRLIRNQLLYPAEPYPLVQVAIYRFVYTLQSPAGFSVGAQARFTNLNR